MHKNEALPCPAGLDPASHPVETVGTRRVALGYDSIREFDISTSLLNMSMSQPEHVLQHKEARKYR